MFEDRERNIWVGTDTTGLHILRRQKFRTLPSLSGNAIAHCASRRVMSVCCAGRYFIPEAKATFGISAVEGYVTQFVSVPTQILRLRSSNIVTMEWRLRQVVSQVATVVGMRTITQTDLACRPRESHVSPRGTTVSVFLVTRVLYAMCGDGPGSTA